MERREEKMAVQPLQLSLVVDCTEPTRFGEGGPAAWGPDCSLYVWLGPTGPSRICVASMPRRAGHAATWGARFVLPVDRPLKHASLELEVVRRNVARDVGTSSRQLLVGRASVADVGKCLRAAEAEAEAKAKAKAKAMRLREGNRTRLALRVKLRRRNSWHGRGGTADDGVEGTMRLSIFLAYS